jgi:L-iditol 2-dehydrogenase
MKALVLKDYRHLAVEEAPAPEVGSDEVLVRVRACGICGSDVHGFDGSSGRRIPPLIMGHEAAGEIADVGAAVRAWKTGDRVTFDSTVWCGTCWHCRRGEVNLCDDRRVLGVSCAEYRRHGAFAEFVAVPERILYRLPDSLSFEKAAMVEAVSVAVHAARRTPLELNASVVVIGAGMIGLLTIQVLKLSGCGRVIAVDTDAGRLQRALLLGATDAMQADGRDVPECVRAIAGKRGADAAFEAVGLGSTVKTAVESVRKGGSVTLIGNLDPRVEIPLQSIVTRQITLIGSCASAGEYPACLDLISSGKINVTDFITATPPLEEGPLWFDRLYAREPGLMKVLLKP